jgi:hypothetical protein
MSEPIFTKLSICIVAPDTISKAFSINPSHQSICVLLLGNGLVKTFPRQQIHVTIQETLDPSFFVQSVSYQWSVCGTVYFPPSHGNAELLESFSMLSVSYQRKVGDLFFPEVLAVITESLCSSCYQSDYDLLLFLFVASLKYLIPLQRELFTAKHKERVFQVFYSRFGIIPNSMGRVLQKLMVT